MILAQGSKCAICDYLFKSVSDAFVDHNHKTGKIRGILCNRCNSGLGFLGDNSDLLKKAIVYLKE